MNAESFWKLIDQSRKAAGGDPEEQLEHLQELLQKLEPAEIVAFDERFTELYNKANTWPLWGAAYVIGGGCSDDGFAYFREWLISRGQKVFEEALADPDSLAKVVAEDDFCELEGLQSLPRQVWAEVTGKDEDSFPPGAPYSGEPTGEQWDEDEVDDLFPRLAKKFG